ncbi:hypothetical protein [Nitrobacter sp.]|uniref:hypothetical protein n=1 Tax=Nitrobacter sp. TaxID=29420 RepID=UPI00399D5D3B
MTGMIDDPAFGVAKSPQRCARPVRKSDIRGTKRLERFVSDRASQNIENAHDLFAKPLTLWWIMR